MSAPLIRPAATSDLLGLMSVWPEESLHRERLVQQDSGRCQYLLAADPGFSRVYGFVLLLWHGDEHHSGYPLLADLLVREAYRGQGIGTRLVEHAERLCQSRGLSQIGLSVNPTDNPRAYDLYRRLGYRPTSAPPHCDVRPVTDEQGRFRLYEDWCISLIKLL